jgi:transposase
LHEWLADSGRPSIPPEPWLRALLRQARYTIRCERLLMEEIDSSIRFRWLIGLSLDDPIWSPTTFRKNRKAESPKPRAQSPYFSTPC